MQRCVVSLNILYFTMSKGLTWLTEIHSLEARKVKCYLSRKISHPMEKIMKAKLTTTYDDYERNRGYNLVSQ